jgi:cyanophycinase
MSTSRTFGLAITATLTLTSLCGAQTAPSARPVFGPAHGSLVIVGGHLQDPAIYRRFIQLAGGPDAPILVIPTAGGAPTYDDSYAGLQPWRDAGATHVHILHTYDRAVADTEAFVAPIEAARGVFFDGGRQWRLADVYLHTRTQRALNALLDRGGVIGGSSAGATIIGSFLVRGDTKTNTIMVGDHTEGLGFLQHAAIDQHVLVRNRPFDLVDVIRSRPDLIGIGIDENTAIVVRGDQFVVIGRSYALVYDHAQRSNAGRPFFFLAAGDRYDLAAHRSIRPRPEPLSAVSPSAADHDRTPTARGAH